MLRLMKIVFRGRVLGCGMFPLMLEVLKVVRFPFVVRSLCMSFVGGYTFLD